MRITDYFQVGGSLESGHPSYVEREADFKLIECLEKDKYCFILNSRQMGKSSLMLQTAGKLIAKNITCAFGDLSLLGLSQNENQNQNNEKQNQDSYTRSWYKSFIFQLLESLGLDTEIDLDSWWRNNNDLTPEAQLTKFFNHVLLLEITGQLVIFIDEIDSISNQPFKDSFFALLRGFYNQRGINSKYKRLSFCLIGVATPYDLIEDKDKTPFNIGESIELTGLTFDNAKKSLIAGLEEGVNQSEKVLQEILYWTGGQPFLTQRLCKLVVENAVNNQVNVEEIVRKFIIDNWQQQDDNVHFKTINDRLLGDHNIVIKLLDIYQQIWQGKKISADDSIEQNKLILSGLVRNNQGYLKVFNPIYKEIFNEKWIAEQLNNDNIRRPYLNELNMWVNSGKNEQYLLTESQLTEAEKWAESKSLATIDYQFINASKDKIRQQEKLKFQKETEEIRLSAEQEKGKIRKHRKIAIISAISISLLSLIAGGVWILNEQKYKISNKIEEYNKELNQEILRFDSGEQLDSLAQGIITAKNAEKLCENNQELTQLPCLVIVAKFNQILNNIQINNQLKIDQENHDNIPITNIFYTDEGKKILAWNKNGKSNQWNLENKTEKNDNNLPIIIDIKDIKDIVINEEEEKIFIGISKSEGGAIRAFDYQGNPKEIFDIDGVTSLAISADGEMLVSGDDNGKISLWKKDGTLITTWDAHNGTINDMTFSPDGKIVASAGSDNSIKLWLVNPSSNQQNPDDRLIATLNGHQGSVNTLAFHPNGNLLASGDNVGIYNNKGEIKLWLLSNFISYTQQGIIKKKCPEKQPLCNASVATFRSEQGSITDITFSPDGQYLLSGSYDKTINLWLIEGINSNIEGDLLQTFKGHQTQVNSVAFNPDGKSFASGDNKGIINIWQIAPTDKKKIFAGIFSPDKQKIILAEAKNNRNNTVTINHRKDIQKTPVTNPHEINKNYIDHQKNSQKATLNNPQNSEKIIIDNPNPVKKIPSLNQNNLQKLNNSIASIAISNDEKTIVVGTDSGIIYKFNTQQDTDDWEAISGEDAYQDKIIALDFHPQKQEFISLGINYQDNQQKPYYVLKLWHKDGDLIKTFNPDNQEELTAVSFHPSEDKFITATVNGKIELWEINSTTNNIIKTEIVNPNKKDSKQEKKEITSIKISSPDGKLIATIARQTLEQKSNLSANDQLKTEIQLYTIDGKSLANFDLADSNIVNINFSKDGKTILTLDSLGQVKSWDLDLEKLIKIGCNWLQDSSYFNEQKQDLINNICQK